jgi:hypothetical protein
MIDRI